MRLLLDTCTFLWAAWDDPALSLAARSAITDGSNEVFLSPVSGWEISVKHGLGRLSLPVEPARLVPEVRNRLSIETLLLEEEAVFQLARLPDYHRDPFDRMLICQAIHHGLILVTPDEAIRRYPVRTMW